MKNVKFDGLVMSLLAHATYTIIGSMIISDMELMSFTMFHMYKTGKKRAKDGIKQQASGHGYRDSNG